MSSLSFAVQKAVDRLLVPALASFQAPGMPAPGVAVYDQPPANAPYPYVRFGRKIVTPENETAANGARVQITLTVFSDFRGSEQVDEILARIQAVLDDAPLALDAGRSVRCDLERSDTTQDADGVTYIGSAVYAVLVEA